MKYYVSIHTKSSTTKLGKLLTREVLAKYNNALLTKEQAEALPAWLSEKIEEISAGNKRLSAMEVRTTGYISNGPKRIPYGATATIWAVTETGAKAFEDNRPFTIYLNPVEKDYTEKHGDI